MTLEATLLPGWVVDRWEVREDGASVPGCGPSTTCELPEIVAGLDLDVTVHVKVDDGSDPPPPPPPPPGAIITWTGGAGTADWFTAGNWDLNRVPAATDDVVIALAGATVDLGNTAIGSAEPHAEIRSLQHSAGTLRIRGPSNCANCVRLTIEQGVTSTGSSTRLEMERSQLLYRTTSTFAALQAGDLSNGAFLGGSAATLIRPSVTIQRALGRLGFNFSDVTIVEAGDLVHGVGLQGGSRLTIASGAIVTVSPAAGGGDGSIGEGSPDTLVVEGMLRVPQSNFNFVHTTVAATGVLEIQFARFNWGLTNHGSIRGITQGQGAGIQAFPLTSADVTLEAGSSLIADQVDFRSTTVVRGRLQARNVIAAGQAGWPLTVADGAQVVVANLGVGPGQVEIGALASGSDIDILGSSVSLLAGATPIRIASPGLSLDLLDLANRGLAGGTSGSRVVAKRVSLAGAVTLDNIELDIAGASTDISSITGSGILGGGVRGSNGARVIQRSPLRLLGAVLSPLVPASEARQFYFEHRGAITPQSGASVIRGCITTDGGTFVSGSGTLDMQALDAGQC